jgi:hypothetical protein
MQRKARERQPQVMPVMALRSLTLMFTRSPR